MLLVHAFGFLDVHAVELRLVNRGADHRPGLLHLARELTVLIKLLGDGFDGYARFLCGAQFEFFEPILDALICFKRRGVAAIFLISCNDIRLFGCFTFHQRLSEQLVSVVLKRRH